MSARDAALLERLERLERRMVRLHLAWGTLCVALVSALPFALSASAVSPLNGFSNGTVANAAEVNENFASLESAVNDNNARLDNFVFGGGKVGIGTTSLQDTLNVQGGVRASSFWISGGTLQMHPGCLSYGTCVASSTRIALSAGQRIQYVAANPDLSGMPLPAHHFDTATAPALAGSRLLSVSSAGAEKFNIDKDGKVAVLTPTPSQALEVKGGIQIDLPAGVNGGDGGQGLSMYARNGNFGLLYTESPSCKAGDVTVATATDVVLCFGKRTGL